ncbi:hypothetical protein AGABI1DRAFT_125385 [Agaricus bisporus var. burnettii JB137-S8]|uniref:Uncharacterized protein n=1 Tax=Agaricus bisporus var. burnettii (strain JB137-S8 / ATCC MYA-4627 / FGSC 10392) TaxID=597362 RepID=K5XHI3_AGABU|nr:uncharacterized protein AGABI1DRAFT_125385 [Agaricus bisporus var. burnettii JB137-S8]EKM82918.1 hypothetical protein AGABI1DRAFT_125385 [Agaricus bisporus var. burnettii JB137-S8]
MVVTTPIDYTKDLLAVANKFTLLDFVWVKMSAFQQPCPPHLIPIETRYSNEINTLLYIRYRLNECIPEIYHTYLRDLSEVATNFGRLAQQQRSNLMAKLHSAVQIIFAKLYPKITLHLLRINYGSAFLAYKQRLEMHEQTPRFQRIINMWNARLFGILAGADAEEFNFDSVDSRSAAIDAALSGGIHDASESEVISGPSFMPTPDWTPSVASLGSSRLLARAPLSLASGIHREAVPPPTTVISSHTAGTLASWSNSVVYILPASNPGSVLSLANDQDNFSDSEGTEPELETIPPQSSLLTASIIQITESNIIHSESTQPSMVAAASLRVTTLTLEPPIVLVSDISPVSPVESALTPGDDNQVVNNAPTHAAKRGRPKTLTQAKDQAVTCRSTRNQRG